MRQTLPSRRMRLGSVHCRISHMDHSNPIWRLYIFSICAVLIFSLSVDFTTGHAQTLSAKSICGNGSAPDYDLNYDLLQPHWTVGWEGYASQRIVNEVDTVLDELNEDSIAQTMILIQPQEQVGIRTNCA